MNSEERREIYQRAETLLSEQNFAAAIITGAVATALAAAAYGIAVAVWPIAYGFAAAAIGVVTGAAIGFVGRGISMRFAVLATVYTILGCTLGGFFKVVVEKAISNSISPIDVINTQAFDKLLDGTIDHIFSIVLIYWSVAVVCAVFLARRPLSRADRLAIGTYEMNQ